MVSHTTTVETQFRDPDALAAACETLGLSLEVKEKHRMFDGKTANNVHVFTPRGWSQRVAVDTATGTCHYDNYNGAWGALAALDAVKQEYAVEVAKRELRRKGYRFREVREGGRVKLVAST